MTKIVKLSLVAALAVAGMTNVNAASLEEAIKNVDVSGQFRFRANDMSDKKNTITNTSTSGNNGTDVEIEIGVKVPVTETVTAVFKIDNANDDTDNVTKGAVNIEDYYFSYNSGALTVNAGQQNIPGRMTDGAQGDGIVALYNLGNFTVGAAAFMTNNVSDGSGTPATVDVDGQDLYSVIAMGNVGPVSVLGQYADVKDTLDAYNVKADASIAMVKVGAEYTEVELDSASALELSTAKAYVSAKVGIVSAKLSYAKTGDNGSGSIDSFAGSAVTSGFSTETPSEFLLWNVGTAGRADFDIVAIDASVAITPAISLRAAYAAGEQSNGANSDVKEMLGQVSYKVAKNLMTYVRYADVEDQGVEYNRGRVEVKYSF
jgi:hypothetical protein